MPIAATPFAQLVLALATYRTLPVTVLLLVGEETDTVAKADTAEQKTSRERP